MNTIHNNHKMYGQQSTKTCTHSLHLCMYLCMLVFAHYHIYIYCISFFFFFFFISHPVSWGIYKTYDSFYISSLILIDWEKKISFNFMSTFLAGDWLFNNLPWIKHTDTCPRYIALCTFMELFIIELLI